jgi:hypothetical protein
MSIYRSSHAVSALAGALFAGFTFIIAAILPGCSQPAALKTVADQNAANATAYAANVSTLAAAARDLARTQAGAVVLRSREHVSTDLLRLRAAITPTQPTDSELTDPAAPWAAALAQEVGELTTRVNAAPPDQRPSLAAALADEHPATIDLAIATPGFSVGRVLRDAVELDRANALIEAEPNAAVRSALLLRRNAILDPYLAPKLASDASARYLVAVDRFLSTLDEQGRILGVHANALAGYGSAPPLHGNLFDALRNPDLRSAALDLVARTSGSAAADDLRDRLSRADEAIGSIAAIASH